MAYTFGRDPDPFLLKEGDLYIGNWITPNLIGTNANAPSSYFTAIDHVGFTKMGTMALSVQRTYAEAKSNTPQVIVRKDLTEKIVMLNSEVFQYNVDVIELIMGTKSQKNHVITSPSSQTGQISFLGSNEPIQPAWGFLLRTELTNGNPFEIGIFYGRSQATDVSITLSGTDYATQKLEVTAFPHPDFVAPGDDQRWYGVIFERTA